MLDRRLGQDYHYVLSSKKITVNNIINQTGAVQRLLEMVRSLSRDTFLKHETFSLKEAHTIYFEALLISLSSLHRGWIIFMFYLIMPQAITQRFRNDALPQVFICANIKRGKTLHSSFRAKALV